MCERTAPRQRPDARRVPARTHSFSATERQGKSDDERKCVLPLRLDEIQQFAHVDRLVENSEELNCAGAEHFVFGRRAEADELTHALIDRPRHEDGCPAVRLDSRATFTVSPQRS